MRSIDSIYQRPFFCPPAIYIGKVGSRKKRSSILRTVLAKLSILVLMIGFGMTQVSFIQSLGFFSDIESSTQDTLASASLDFSLNALNWSNTKVSPGGSISRTIDVIKNPGSLDFRYNAKTVILSGDPGFCSALLLLAKLDGAPIYTGTLTGLDFSPPIIVGGDGTDNWEFIVRLPPAPSFDSLTCQFKFEFVGWQQNIAFGGGWDNTEEVGSDLSDPPADVLITEEVQQGPETVNTESVINTIEAAADSQEADEGVAPPEPVIEEPSSEELASNTDETPETVEQENPVANEPEGGTQEEQIAQEQPAVEPEPTIAPENVPAPEPTPPDGSSGSGASQTE